MSNKIPDGATHRDNYDAYYKVDSYYIKLWDGYFWAFFDYATQIHHYELIEL